MAFSIYDIAVPHTLHMLGSSSAVIDKAMAHCAARKIDPAVMVNFRLAPDMHPFSRQIQIMCDQAARMSARLAGVDMPSFPDTETTFEELKARIAKTKAYAQGFTAAQFESGADRPVVIKFPNGMELKFANGLEYVTKMFFPNFYFHATTAYDILRHLGVEIGKRDFAGM